ncbi:hypothetical protein ONJ17_25365, partial [Salmonella enterica subsp. enterica serovar Agona]|nr:hypothetical protein [Salmonella enterica subsp. enterica serovar Agona]
SHGLIDFIVLSGNSSKLWLFPIVGAGYAIVYYTVFRVLIKALFNTLYFLRRQHDANCLRAEICRVLNIARTYSSRKNGGTYVNVS